MSDFCFGNQINLGQLIKLVPSDIDIPVVYDFGGLIPTRPDSYRGFYDHLAFGWRDGDWGDLKTQEFRKWITSAMGQTYHGYKGGCYVMDGSTPLWVAAWGKTSETAVIGVENQEWQLIIRTEYTPH